MYKTVNSVYQLDYLSADGSCFDDDEQVVLELDDDGDDGFSTTTASEECSEAVIRSLGRTSTDRFFVDLGPASNSILASSPGKSAATTSEETAPSPSEDTSSLVEESVAVAVDSEDPYGDFRASMEEMVAAHGLRGWEALEELLVWYLRINSKHNHALIVGAFVDLLVGLATPPSSSSAAPTATTTATTESPISPGALPPMFNPAGTCSFSRPGAPSCSSCSTVAVVRSAGAASTGEGSGVVIELGCAQGHLTFGLATAFPKARFVGVDLSRAALESACQRTRPLGNCEFVLADAADLGRTWGRRPKADLLVISEVLYYLGGARRVAEAMAGVAPALAAGARIVLLHPSSDAQGLHAAAVAGLGMRNVVHLRYDDPQRPFTITTAERPADASSPPAAAPGPTAREGSQP